MFDGLNVHDLVLAVANLGRIKSLLLDRARRKKYLR